MEPSRVDRSKIRVLRMKDAPEMEVMEGTYAERIAVVWELTCNAWAMTGEFDVESRLRRDLVHLQRP
jgi:hypothetical protein